MFENQINTALSKGYRDDTRPSTPSGSSVCCSPHTRGRPGTRDSAQSGLSRLTMESQPVSVLGVAKGHARHLSPAEIEQAKTISTVDGRQTQRLSMLAL